ncbi:MAG: transposase [Desulfobacterales bacterium]|jgi:REP element-mobilizing transposase RayT
MPRKARIDAPGALQHIIGRGIERRKIFWTDADRDDFVERLGAIIEESSTECYAWALLPNHFHLLLKTGNLSLAMVMRRLLTGYVVRFNRRHGRSGHLFQNRYKSILCQEDAYLLELVRYIHLNPLRAKVVNTLRQLDRYVYCGHSVIMGHSDQVWQNAPKVLRLFGKRISSARKHYRGFINRGIAKGKRPDLIGGGVIRSAGGWTAFKAKSMQRVHLKGDERILGDSDFVKTVLEEARENLERRYRLQAQDFDFKKVLHRVGEVLEIDPQEILLTGKQPLRVRARSLVCYWAVNELGMAGTEIAKILGLTQPAVSKAVQRGEKLASDYKLSLAD